MGFEAETMPLPVGLTASREISITGVFRYVDTWPGAVALANAGMVHLEDMVTATYALGDVDAALDADSEPRSIQAVVSLDPADQG